jgi:2,5-dihydroxypyridine 5,6-dioxygenase
MHGDVIEGKWIDCFTRAFELCKVREGEVAAIVSETQSRRVLVKLAELALLRLKAQAFHIVIPTPPVSAPVPVRSTGHSVAIGQNPAIIKALTTATFIADLTIEGLLHSIERPEILASGTRVFMISNEHPESLERLMPDPALKPKVLKGVAMAKQAKKMRVTSAAGTDLHIDMEGANVGGGCGISDEKGQIDYWPGGLCAFYPRPGAVTGTVVMVAGDINLTFKRYLSDPVHMQIERDCITEIHGPGMDADLMKSYFAAWQDPNAYYTSHLGWGMNPRARWDTLVMFDRNDTNGTEQRAFAGNFLFSTGSNRFANRFTDAHFDLPMRNCTIELDGQIVVEKGNLIPELA